MKDFNNQQWQDFQHATCACVNIYTRQLANKSASSSIYGTD